MHVVLLAELPETALTEARSIPGVALTNLGHHTRRFFGGRQPTPQEKAALEAEQDAVLADAEVLLAISPPANLMARTPRLRWLQCTWAGVDTFKSTGVLDSDVIVTTGKGVAARPIAEWTLGMMLAMARQLPSYLRQQDERSWKRFEADLLIGKTVLVIGVGALGAEIARLCGALGLEVIGCRRDPGVAVPGIGEMIAPDRLIEALPRADYVVIAAPLTAETRGMIGAAELAAMKPTARLLNVGRGPLVQTDALVAALAAGTIAGAALDVFEQEPLPPDSPLWTAPNVILTPHISGTAPGFWDDLAAIFLDNLRRYQAGEPLRNVYDVSKGY